MTTHQRQRRSPRPFASWTLCSLQWVFALLHLVPPWAYSSAGRTSVGVVAYINSLGPIWTIDFGLTSMILTVALLLRPKLLWVAHLLCGASFAAYSSALFFSAAFNHPAGPFTYPTLALFIFFAHGVLGYSYGGDR